jgi:hypothetical protein
MSTEAIADIKRLESALRLIALGYYKADLQTVRSDPNVGWSAAKIARDALMEYYK